jgi:hypothetical protein
MRVDNNTAIAIESYLRSISLTNTSLGGNGNTNYERLQQADEMAIQWITDKYLNIIMNNNDSINTNTATTIMNISNPIVQQRLQQLFAIVTIYYSAANYENNNGMNWTNATDWLQSKIHECYWHGITCRDYDDDGSADNDMSDPTELNDDPNSMSTIANALSPTISNRTITSITLPLNNMVGPIHPNIGLLTGLTSLDLSNNNLTGTIPTTLSNFTDLSTFKVQGNAVTGTLPEELGISWSESILQFNVGSNRLTGTIPSEVGLWVKILFFEIDNNELNGSIPDSIVNWTNATKIRFDFNDLNGTIPNALCTTANGKNATIKVDQGEVECDCCNFDDDDNSNMPTNAPQAGTPSSNSPTAAPRSTSVTTPTDFNPTLFDNASSESPTNAPTVSAPVSLAPTRSPNRMAPVVIPTQNPTLLPSETPFSLLPTKAPTQNKTVPLPEAPTVNATNASGT